MSLQQDLQKFSVVSDLSEDQLALLAKAARECRYGAGETILEKDAPGASMFLIAEGQVKVLLPRREGESLRIGTLGPGEFFGEMSLFSGRRRSAMVVAESDARLIEIQREDLLEQVSAKPDLALQILGVMSERMRSSDERVSELADRVYFEAYPRIDSALSSQLDAAKVVYEKTEDRANRVLGDVERSWTTLTRMITIILGVASVVGAGLAYLGFTEIQSITQEFEDTRVRIEEDVRNIAEQRELALATRAEIDDMAAAARDAAVVKEIALTIDKIRREFGLDQAPDLADPEVARQFAIQFRDREPALFAYFMVDGTGPLAAQADLVIEAARVYTGLMQENVDFRPSAQKIGTMIYALLYVLDRLPQADWQTRLRVRDALRAIGSVQDGKWRLQVIKDLERRLDDGSQPRPADLDLAQVLYELRGRHARAREILRDAMQKARSPWTRLDAAGLLLQERDDPEVWDYLLSRVDRMNPEGYIAAMVLARIGAERLRQFGICKHRDRVLSGQPLQSVRAQLQRHLAPDGDTDDHANPYMLQYTRTLIDQLEGRC